MTKMTWNQINEIESKVEADALKAFRQSMKEQGYLLNPTKITPQWDAAYQRATAEYNKVKDAGRINYSEIEIA